MKGCGGTVGSIASSQLQGPWCDFELQLQSVWSDPGSSHVAWVSPIQHAGRWIGDSKLPVSVNECVNMCAYGILIHQWSTATLTRIYIF